MDINATRNLQQFVELFAKTVIGKLETPSQSVLRKITTLFSSYKPVLSIDELTGMPSFSITVSNDQKEESLKHVFCVCDISILLLQGKVRDVLLLS